MELVYKGARMKTSMGMFAVMWGITCTPFATVAWASPADAALFIGVSARDITPEWGVPLAGFGGGERRNVPYDVQDKYPYAHFLTPSQGQLDPIRAKAIYLESGNDKWLWIGLDTVAVPDELRTDLVKMLQILDLTPEQIWISATHTHSGPGDLTHNKVWEFLATDLFHPTVYNRFLIDVWSVALEALGSTQRGQLRWSAPRVEGLQSNRTKRTGHFDPEARVLWLLTASGKVRAAVVNFAVHGTSLGKSNLSFSADLPGAIERAMESEIASTLPSTRKPMVMFINGAEGDVTPTFKNESGMVEGGKTFALQVTPSFHASQAIPNARWKLRKQTVALGSARVNLAGCAGQGWLGDLLTPFKLNIGALMPSRTEIFTAELGPLYFMSLPGEPTTDIGLHLKKLARDNGWPSPWIVGLTNQHLAYFLTPDEYSKPGYQSCACLYPNAGTRLIAAHRGLIPKFKP